MNLGLKFVLWCILFADHMPRSKQRLYFTCKASFAKTENICKRDKGI